MSAARGVAGAGGAGAEPLAQPGQAREFQIHIFAPPVTGALIKKTMGAGAPLTSIIIAQAANSPAMITSSTASATTSSAFPALQHASAKPNANARTSSDVPPQALYPATNEQGQRICQQCGMAGRYKDGKCIEKWGPGPMRPETVCDRCHKKIKHVERRGTLENQAQAWAQAQAQALTQAQAQRLATIQQQQP